MGDADQAGAPRDRARVPGPRGTPAASLSLVRDRRHHLGRLDDALTVVAGNLCPLLARKLDRYENATPHRIWRDFPDATGTLLPRLS